jgi:glycolate oxidase FAD binding subunit
VSETIDRTGLSAGLETAGIAWKELDEAERKELAVDGVRPSAICWPASYEEAAKALAVADRLGIAVSPRGGGTKIGLGNPPRAVDLIVSTERLNRIVDYAPANLTMIVEAGIGLAAVQEKLAENGQFLALDPPNADRATIGGIVAANASGPSRLGYGSARDLVIGTRVATTRGTVAKAGGRVVKNVAGYDLNKLYVGSLGTLALVVEVGFKIAPRPSARATVIGRFARLDQLGEAARQVVRSPLMPTALDLLNAPAARALYFPGLPDVGDGYLLAALGTAPGGAADRQRSELARIFRAAGADEIVDFGDAMSPAFWSQVAERPSEWLGLGAIRVKIAVPISQVGRIVRAIEERGDAVGQRPAIGGRAGSGVLHATWNVPEAGFEGRGVAERLGLGELRELARSLGGSLVLEDCPRALKDELDVWGDVGPSLVLMKRLKAALDPRGTMNPGRFVGGI